MSTPGASTDDQAADEHAATGELYERLGETLMRTAALMVDNVDTAWDIVHDAFAEVIERWPGIDPAKAQAYLFRAVSNRARSALRRRRTSRAFLRGASPPPDEEPADTKVLRAAGHELILGAIARLPTRQRQVLVLRFYCELSVAQAADALGISKAAVAVATNHALTNLQHLRKELS